MKTLKVTKRMLKMHPADLLLEVNAVDKERRNVYPQYVFFSKEDYKELSKNLKQYAKKKMKGSPERIVNYAVGVDLLNYGPNETLAEAIRPGYMLVDYEGIETGTKNNV